MRKNAVKKKSEWTKPRKGFAQINVYASFNPENISCGIGTVIRDGNGDFIVT
jgi:hypothetical protein